MKMVTSLEPCTHEDVDHLRLFDLVDLFLGQADGLCLSFIERGAQVLRGSLENSLPVAACSLTQVGVQLRVGGRRGDRHCSR
jgi:hypothetical protein